MVSVIVAVPMACTGCHSRLSANGHSIRQEARTSLPAYVHLKLGGNGQSDGRRYFPLLQVYDSDGALLYTGHNASTNATLLKDIPGSIAGLKPVADSVSLQDATSEISAFRNGDAGLLMPKRPTLVMVSLEDCHACSVQEHAVDENDAAFRKADLNVLTLRVER